MRTPGLLLAIVVLPWQTPAAQAPAFRSGVELVDVAVIVRDRDGRVVLDLTQEDFQITEQGAPQTIAAFDRVSVPVVRAADLAAAPVARDVSTNEQVTEARIFVLLLDALHVAPQRSGDVRRLARQFIEEHVGANDLVAVLSPGGLPAATQDFTSDTARLLAAVDQFAGNKPRSATAEIGEEARTGAGLLRARPGGDPSDHERAMRAQALTSTLQALATHLERIERRRKSVLLFSEGIDYNQMDAMGVTQMWGSDVSRAMTRAVGALMRTNVSLYAVDPRGLTSVEGDLVEVQAHGMPRGSGGLGNTVDQEFGDSIRSLRYVSESTGGFAAVDTSTFGGAFARIVEESSTYYVLGYTPSKPGKPGEFREIGVRVSRPGLRVTARKGYMVPASQPAAVAYDASAFGGAPAFPSRRPLARPGAAVMDAEAAPRVTGSRPAGDLQALLASPLPRAGLTMRLQAIPFRKDAKKGDVQLIVEVVGRGLTFTERDGRFEERIELAMLTVDSSAKAANGRTTAIDLRLTPAELERVRATGVRWLWRLELPPGRHNVRVAGRATHSATTGVLTTDVEVPRHDPTHAAMSGVTMTSETSVLMITRGDTRRAGSLETPPSAARVFVAGDRIVAAADVYIPASAARVDVVAHVEWPDGSRTPLVNAGIAGPAGRPHHETVAVPVDTSHLPPGRYLLRIMMTPAGRNREHLERRVPFEIVAPPSHPSDEAHGP